MTIFAMKWTQKFGLQFIQTRSASLYHQPSCFLIGVGAINAQCPDIKSTVFVNKMFVKNVVEMKVIDCLFSVYM
jgi:hypothetical protein